MFSRKRLSKYKNNIQKKNNTNEALDWTKYINKTYVLNLPRRTDRRQNIKDELSQIKTSDNDILYNKITWWEGFEEIDELNTELVLPDYSFFYHWQTEKIPLSERVKSEAMMMDTMIRCTNSEIAIALSHISILQDIVKNYIDVACIMEDDVFLRYDFVEKMNSIFESQIPPSFDILYLSSLSLKFGFKWEEFSKDLKRVYNGLRWTSGFLITKHAAKRLLDNLPVIGPIDVWLNHQFPYLEVYMTKQNLLEQDFTNISSDNTLSFYKNCKYTDYIDKSII